MTFPTESQWAISMMMADLMWLLYAATELFSSCWATGMEPLSRVRFFLLWEEKQLRLWRAISTMMASWTSQSWRVMRRNILIILLGNGDGTFSAVQVSQPAPRVRCSPSETLTETETSICSGLGLLFCFTGKGDGTFVAAPRILRLLRLGPSNRCGRFKWRRQDWTSHRSVVRDSPFSQVKGTAHSETAAFIRPRLGGIDHRRGYQRRWETRSARRLTPTSTYPAERRQRIISPRHHPAFRTTVALAGSQQEISMGTALLILPSAQLPSRISSGKGRWHVRR